MTEDVLVVFSSYQKTGDDTQHMEVINKGSYFHRNGYHYVLYEEVMEGFKEPVKNRMKFRDGLLTVTKKGIINANMIFEPGEKTACRYMTPYGEMFLGINTSSIDFSESEDKMTVDADYVMEANCEHLADCKIHIEITSKEKGISII